MLSKTKFLAVPIAAAVLLALPATGAAGPKRCNKTPQVGYTISGTLVSVAGDPASVTLTVTEANSHATNSGEIDDQDSAQEGVQVAGDSYTVDGASDSFTLTLEGFEGADTPSPGDAVKVIGKVPRTKKKCAAAGTSEADRYGAPNVRKVVITDSDPDA